jgi:acyl carrier protein
LRRDVAATEIEDTMEEKLRGIVSRIGEIELNFSADAHLNDDLGIDSFRAVEIVFEIERTFGIKVPDARYGEVQTFADMVKLVASLTG